MEQYPDWKQLLALAQSPAGQQLLTVLKNSGPAAAKKAADCAAAGDWAQAKAALAKLLSDDEIQRLAKQLEGTP